MLPWVRTVALDVESRVETYVVGGRSAAAATEDTVDRDRCLRRWIARLAGLSRVGRVDRRGPFTTFEASAPHDLWQGDILHGPKVLVGGKTVRCKVVCWLDDHSRHVCHLEAYPDETQAAIEDSLKKAIRKHGAPLAVFLDNAKDQLGEKIPFNNVARSMALVQKALLRSYEQNVVPVVIVDDAQALDTRAWLGLKTLTDFEMDSKMPFCLWLLGSRQELLAPLRQSGLAEVRSRLQFCFHLKNVQEQEIGPYLAAHLKWAGCDRALFPPDVSREIDRLTHGLARQINRLAWHCLMAAALETKDLVDQSCLDQAVTEVQPPELS